MPNEREPEPAEKSNGNIPINQREHSNSPKVGNLES